MTDFFRAIASFFIRISAFLSKEYATAVSQPNLVGVLILGPFLILLIFGVSFRDLPRILRAMVVVPPQSGLEDTIREFTERPEFVIDILEITPNETGALTALTNKVVDIVIIVPEDPLATLESNRRATLTFYHREIDPFEAAYVQVVATRITDETNRQIHLAAVSDSKEVAGILELQVLELAAGSGAGDGLNEMPADIANLNPSVIVEPFTHETRPLNLEGIEPVHFYFPIALALLLQHIAISLSGLSIVSERLTGTLELMRAAPVNPIEGLIGKYLSLLILVGIVTAALSALAVMVLGVPLAGGLPLYALIVFLLVFVSLGIGFLISSFVQSESQAIQISMVLLLATIFFSGLFLPLYKLWWPAQTISWSMPATYGAIMLRDAMLLGVRPAEWLFQALGGAGAVLFILNWLRIRRLMGQV